MIIVSIPKVIIQAYVHNFLQFYHPQVSWLVKGKPVDPSDADNVHFASTLLPGDIVEASVTLKVKFK